VAVFMRRGGVHAAWRCSSGVAVFLPRGGVPAGQPAVFLPRLRCSPGHAGEIQASRPLRRYRVIS
jgi:hypothetical protein